MVERAFERVPQAELYATTGIQTLPINTVFQLLADEGSAALAAAERHRARARPARLLALRRARERVHQRLDHRAARRAQRRLGGRADRAARAARAACSATLVEPGHGARAAARPPRARRRRPIYAVASHDTASAFAAAPGARRARRDPLERHVVAARARAARAGARRRRPRGQPHQRARRRRHDAAAQERDGHVAAGGVPARVGRRGLLRGAAAARRVRRGRRAAVRPRRPELPRARRHAGADRGRLRGRPARPTSPRSCAASWSRSPASTAG